MAICYFSINFFIGRSRRCTDCNNKQLVFVVKKGTDSTLLWKGTVRIACVKVDLVTRKVETHRLLNLSEFLKVSHKTL